jgi:hypothetical protein
VPSLEEALRELQLEPVHAPARALFGDGLAARLVRGEAAPADVAALRERHATFLRAVAAATGVDGDPDVLAAAVDRAGRVFGPGAASAPVVPVGLADRAALLACLFLARTGELARGADVPATSRAWYDELRLAPVLADGFRELGLDEAEAWNVAELVRILLELPRPGTLPGAVKTAGARLLDAWLARDHLRAAMGVNTWQGTEWLDRDRFTALLGWAARLDAIDAATAGGPARARRTPAWVTRLTQAAESAGYRLDRLREALGPATAATPFVPRTARSAPASRKPRSPRE